MERQIGAQTLRVAIELEVFTLGTFQLEVYANGHLHVGLSGFVMVVVARCQMVVD